MGGMSGAALFAGPYLVGVVAVDPARYGPDRVVATPISAIGNDPSWWRWLDGDASRLVAVRLELTRFCRHGMARRQRG
jgi:hypothetical protein